MNNKLSFFALTPSQQAAFQGLKSNTELKNHGPLGAGEKVSPHSHSRAALYVVNGDAVFSDSGNLEQALGDKAPVNAVLVPKGQIHAWCAKADNTRIEHVFGNNFVSRVLLTT